MAAAVAVAGMALLPIGMPPIDFRKLVTFAPVLRPADAKIYRDTRWYELGPKDWDPYKEVRALRRNISAISDDDPRARDLLKRTRDIWDHAPTNPALEGAAVRIPGYVVPLEADAKGTSEFLLVPYFGACIHTPAPPSNQIIHVRLSPPERRLRSMDNVWVSGTLKASRSESSMGMSSYAMSASRIEPYVRPAR